VPYPYTITYRSVKGSLLTSTEVDTNFSNLVAYKAEISGSTGALQVPSGTTAQRDTQLGAGSIRYNSTLTCHELYTGSAWKQLPQVPRGHIAGLTMSTAGASTTMTIAAGECADSTNVVMLKLAAAISKTTAAWAVGTGNGALDTGVIAANTTYHWYAIGRSDTGVMDAVCSLSASAPSLPANYTWYRRIGSRNTNGSSQWTKFIQNGEHVMLTTPVQDVSTGTPGSAALSVTLASLPGGVPVEAILNLGIIDTASTDAMYVSALSQDDVAPIGTGAPGFSVRSHVANTSGWAEKRVWSDTNKSIRARVQTGAGTCTIRFVTLGWIDHRGRFD
jgi:hypothetical protein